MPASSQKGIRSHEGKKYLRKIRSPVDGAVIEVDVYAVLVAFAVTCPGRQQAIKKLLCAGERGKGTALADLIGADAALARAIQLQRDQEQETCQASKQCESSTMDQSGS
jgi:hypothetical protein